MIHELKCWPDYYWPMWAKKKTFEVRKGEDRKYEAGDVLKIKLWDPAMKEYVPDHVLTFDVTYVMHGGPWLPGDVWVLGIKPREIPAFGPEA